MKCIRTLILPVTLYGCETWPLTLREEHKLRVLENRVLKRIFGPKREDVVGGCRRLHDFYSPANIFKIKSRLMGCMVHIALWGRSEMHTKF
jgi:hypothetical protein